MQRPSLRTVLAAAALLTAGAAAHAAAGALGFGESPFVREPVFVLESSGGANPEGAGTLVVYNDGRAVYATSGFAPFGLPDLVRTADVPLVALDAFLAELISLDAATLPDFVTNDVLVNTVTLFRPGSTGKQHTFSYSGFPNVYYPQVDAAIQTFIEDAVIGNAIE